MIVLHVAIIIAFLAGVFDGLKKMKGSSVATNSIPNNQSNYFFVVMDK